MNKIILLIIVVVFAGLAIMFDWFGSRDLAQTGMDAAQSTVQKLEETGDRVNDAVDQLNEMKEKK